MPAALDSALGIRGGRDGSGRVTGRLRAGRVTGWFNSFALRALDCVGILPCAELV